jgi:hypothetical protein
MKNRDCLLAMIEYVVHLIYGLRSVQPTDFLLSAAASHARSWLEDKLTIQYKLEQLVTEVI